MRATLFLSLSLPLTVFLFKRAGRRLRSIAPEIKMRNANRLLVQLSYSARDERLAATVYKMNPKYVFRTML